MNAIPKLPKHGRIKEKYNPKPTAREKDYHLWLIDTFPCACDCGASSTVVHHPLQEHPNQRWRRDHEYVVPMNGFCHFDLHRIKGRDEYAEAAADFRERGVAAGKLKERDDGTA